MSIDVSVRELRNHTKQVVERIEDGTTTYLTKNGVRIAAITPIDLPTWAQRVDALMNGEPHDSGLAELLVADDAGSIELDERDLTP